MNTCREGNWEAKELYNSEGNIAVNTGRIINQIVSVCAFLSNFHPALVPPSPHLLDGDVEDYWDQLSDVNIVNLLNLTDVRMCD